MEVFLIICMLILLIYVVLTLNKTIEKLDRRFWELENTLYDIKKQVESLVQPEVKAKESPEITVKEEPILPEPMQVFPEFSTFKTLGELPTMVEEKEELIHAEVELEAEESWYEKFSKRNPDLERFIGENLISKIGIAILVLGIGYFVKFAIDKNWINEIARVGIGILAGGIVLGFAHYLRAQFKAFSSVLVAGGISVFYFTLGIAFQEYHIFSQSITFVLLSVVTAFSVFISLAYNRQELALLSVLGGFAVPLMVSTGEGNYVVLFSYLLLLDTSLLVLAFYRNWSVLNGVTYFLTVLMYGIWLNQKVLQQEVSEAVPYLGALLFASAFYVVFTFSNLINQIKEKQAFRAYELSLIISNTFLYFACAMLIFEAYNPNFKGIFTLLLALFNFAITYFVYKDNKVDKNLFYLLVGLTLTFVTLAAPLQLDGNYITLFWAAEASLLLWLAQKSQLTIYRFVSIPILLLGIISMLIDWNHIYAGEEALQPIINSACMSSIAVLSSLFFYLRLLKNDTESEFTFMQMKLLHKQQIQFVQYLILPILYFAGFFEWHYHVNNLLDSSIQEESFLLWYHLFFVSLSFLVLTKQKVVLNDNLVIVFGLFSLIAYSYCFGLGYVREINFMIGAEGGTAYAYWVHYFCLIPVVHQMLILYPILKQKWHTASAWVFTIMLCFLLSAELQWQGLIAHFSELIAAQQNSEDAYYLVVQMKQSMNKTAFPILWGLLAFVLLSFGIKRAYKPLRISALALIGVTVLKLFLYDIKNVSEGGKIAAFILLGLVLLVISFTYQKIKSIILDEENTADE